MVCFPPKEIVIKQIKRQIKLYNEKHPSNTIKSIFVASDRNHMISELNEVLKCTLCKGLSIQIDWEESTLGLIYFRTIHNMPIGISMQINIKEQSKRAVSIQLRELRECKYAKKFGDLHLNLKFCVLFCICWNFNENLTEFMQLKQRSAIHISILTFYLERFYRFILFRLSFLPLNTFEQRRP